MASRSEDAPAHPVDDDDGRNASVPGFALRNPDEFQRCLAAPALVRGGAFALHVGPRDLQVASCAWRLGLVIPKRFEASAVARNTIKRRWRAAFRRGRDAWAGEFGGADVVVRMQGPLVRKADAAPPKPAKVRARERFDPDALFDALAVRLRARRHVAPPTVEPAPVALAAHSITR